MQLIVIYDDGTVGIEEVKSMCEVLNLAGNIIAFHSSEGWVKVYHPSLSGV